MKLKYTCKLELVDEIPDEEVDEVNTAEEVTKNLKEFLMEGIYDGDVIIKEESVTVER